jgi:hypothetical protein
VTLASSVAYQPFGPLQSLTYGNGLSLWKTFTQDYDLDVLLVEDTSIPQDHDRAQLSLHQETWRNPNR